MKSANRFFAIALVAIIAIISVWADEAPRRRRHITPLNTAATTTQSINETRDDTARINAARRAASTSYRRDDGYYVYVDTVTGEEWVDSTNVPQGSKMKYELFSGINLGVNIWDPMMRLFGQKHGLIDFSADVNLFNRFFPTVEVGLGSANNTPADRNFTYKSPLTIYAKLGLNYNFLFNGNPDYKFFAGVRYGFSPFKWSVENITLNSPYWDNTSKFEIPSQSSTAGWFEICLGLRIKLHKSISAGWTFRYHSILHESKSQHGEPWYIPGYGTRNQAITGSFSIYYTLPIKRNKAPEIEEIPIDDTLATDSIPTISEK